MTYGEIDEDASNVIGSLLVLKHVFFFCVRKFNCKSSVKVHEILFKYICTESAEMIVNILHDKYRMFELTISKPVTPYR